MPRLWKVALVAAGAFVAVEVAVRIWERNWDRSWLADRLELMASAYPARLDAELGWIPDPERSGRDNTWHTQVTITPALYRSNGPPDPSAPPLRGDLACLAVGDSFTFGDAVNDAETWPAALERALGVPVSNAGVFGYGIDQAVLRAELALATRPFDWVILSFIPDDVQRCELALRNGTHKPWFHVVDGELVRENRPVPPPPGARIDAFRRVFSHVWIVHAVMKNANPDYWFHGTSQYLRVHEQGLDVSRLLILRLAAAVAAQGGRLLVVAQYGEQLGPELSGVFAPILPALALLEGSALDLYADQAAVRDREPETWAAFFAHRHMSARGNAWVAQRIARRLAELDPRLELP